MDFHSAARWGQTRLEWATLKGRQRSNSARSRAIALRVEHTTTRKDRKGVCHLSDYERRGEKTGKRLSDANQRAKTAGRKPLELPRAAEKTAGSSSEQEQKEG